MGGTVTDPDDPGLNIIEEDGQQKKYLVLSDEERAKGFVRPVRDHYKHILCGTVTRMGYRIAETYARDPNFYGATYCVNCKGHFPLVKDGERQFKWIGQDGFEDGSFVGE